ncbi:MAG: cobaltochelatase subunit CobN [Gammaproteobacteria bacterium]
MHLLAAKPGGFIDEEGIVDLQQSPGDIVLLSSQDTSLGLLAEVADQLPEDYPQLRLANLVNLSKPAAYDLYEETVLQHSKLIIVAILGGISYWRYGIEQLQELASRRGISLILVPGDDQADRELTRASTCEERHCHNVWRYLREGSTRNTRNLLHYIACELLELPAHRFSYEPPRSLAPCLIYSPGDSQASLEDWQKQKNHELPTALLLFYRSHVQSGNTDAFDQFIAILKNRFNLMAVAALSLKDAACLATVNHLINEIKCDVVINTTSFSQHVEGNAALSSQPQVPVRLFDRNIPVIQAILAANNEQDWSQSSQGLRARDIAMNVVLPEYDGRIISRAISFKELFRRSKVSEIDILRYQLHPERAEFVAGLAWRWSQLRRKPNTQKRIALILANYPTKDGRIGNGVGLDTPASVVNILRALKQNDYPVDEIPADGDALIRQLQVGVTNNLDSIAIKGCSQSISIEDYQTWFEQLPLVNQEAVLERWGEVDADPKFRRGRIMIAGIHLGETFVGIQPARGFNIDLVANYHDPDLVPPHGYLAFYFWLRHVYQADAFAHVGKHGNLEWLPGKSTALSDQCWPDAVFGPMPHLYPFIVNDPGEGAQAKRRAQAVIIDHLMPPMARAETYGDLQELEKLIDEYYQAMGMDQRREDHLREKILTLVCETSLARELNLEVDEAANHDELLGQVDTYLCELKEAQIRHGLHRFGQLPEDHNLAETIVALTRLPRGEGRNDAGILHSLSTDLDLRNSDSELFDPLKFDPAVPWRGMKPALLNEICSDDWRNEADTRERLELLAEDCVDKMLQQQSISQSLEQTRALLGYIEDVVVVAVTQSAEDETGNFLRGLNGEFIPAGPSGAPTRGRLDVLPTGRNFYSIDCRAIPTRSAWELGQLSSRQLLDRHLQEHGEYPRQLGLSVWGTSTMRTGGDDIAQAMALMGVRPVWAEASNRVVDIEIIPGFQLGRPRVDVTLRISGFFRDAFPNVARLFDNAVQALADLEEPGDSNTLRQHIEASREQLIAKGVSPQQADVQARFRVFGSKPGSYGAGLQGLIDEGAWTDQSDLAKAYVNWGGYSYSQGNFGEAAFSAFETRLSEIEVVVQNQDNREHDLLDSDDYYQFQGGMSNAVSVLRGETPVVYHGDHSNPSDPKIRSLKEELNRVIRSRLINPKWINAMREHGYKGAFEMAASVDYLFAYDATTNLIDDYQYESVSDALIFDRENRQFLQQSNPDALKEMAEKLLEAQQRGLWQNPGDYHQQLIDTILEIDNSLEVIS